MKNMFIIILVLAIIFVGMIFYKNKIVNSKNNVSVQEIENIDNYISKIYMWKEVTNEALPVFDNINNADDLWIWEAVKKNIDEYEMSYKQIDEKAKEIFGEKFEKQFPKEGTSFLSYDEQTGNYLATEINLDEKADNFLLSDINKTKQGFSVKIIEYMEDYSKEDEVKVLNLDNQEIGKININESETKIQEIVKNNIDKFSKKIVYLEKEDDRLVVQQIEKE